MANKKSVKSTKTNTKTSTKSSTKPKKSTSASKTTRSVKKVSEFKLFDKSTYWCVGFVVAVIAVIACVYALYRSYESYTRPDYAESAIVYHSESVGNDAGTEYIYSIYKKKDTDAYFFIKSKSEITLVGSSEAKDVSSGTIKNKDSIKKIEKDIEKDEESGAKKTVTYTFVKDGVKTEVVSLEELANKLFA